MTVPLSILDLSPISAGSDAATALRNTIDLAQHAERWGFKRYWVAEHHSVAVASSQPAVLIGQIAAATERIRVGAAAVQLGFTTAIAATEGFGTLEALHPGRIDLGVGRSGQRRRDAQQGTERTAPPEPTAEARWGDRDGVVIPPAFDVGALMRNPRLRARTSVLQQPDAVAPDFDRQVDDILQLVNGRHHVDGVPVRAVPGEGSGLTPWIFGSSRGQSAQVAGARGLPFVASYHITPATALDAVDAYRAAFRPSAMLAEPYVVVSADVVVADDSATAHHLASSYGHWVYSIRAGDGAAPYPDPDAVVPLSEPQLDVVRDRIATQFVGDAEEVADKLQTLQRATAADELVITSVCHRHVDRLRSHELIAKRWGL
ncbi:luciferase family oxidoreductase, group 1 [Mycolicibacterium rutilum]|uniref:Luciferase family oxidoreductase, group 1 n=1 Tax=Mycolicibacterium rutilum TaxID=370526 RepID=A0A1H6IPI7_MYCRU|nr:LLM class flavin-dependent oxidoreductase [Mycolicibacterium rutilum]SEH50662.1 luciferase family oxidoreductase, group 1 [Mycolicibacterium rutilum]